MVAAALPRLGAGDQPATRAVVAHQLTDRPHPEHGYRACLGLHASHARRYGEARLEAACARALAIASPRYRSVTSDSPARARSTAAHGR